MDPERQTSTPTFECGNPKCEGICLACHGPKFADAVEWARSYRPAGAEQ